MNAKSRIAASSPFNVTFYACDFGERFLGCCENGSPASTCTNGCPQEDLLPASFEKVYYDYVTRAACTRGDWWSCANISPPFLGCCLSNPCLGGCPPSDLTAAIFSLNQTDNPLYSAIPHAPAAASSTTSSSTSTAASSTPVRTTGAAHSAITNPSPIQKNSTRRVVGDVVGAVLAVGVIFIGVLLLYRRLKSQAYKGSDSTGTNGKGSIKGILLNSLTIAASSGNLHLTATVPESPTVSKASRQENEASHEFPTIANPREEARVPIRAPRSTNFAPCIENKIPLESYSATSGAQEDHEEDKAPQELPPNHPALPEIASSDLPQSCHELPSSDLANQEPVHPKALQPGRPGFRPYSASSLSQTPQPYGLAFRPHSPSRLSAVSSLASSPPLARGLSPVSVTNDDICANV